MKENACATVTQTSTTTEPTTSGLVEAILELEDEDEDACSSESDEEFLDFQFRIADANANLLQERETSEHNMADWRASFASLQVSKAKQSKSIKAESPVSNEVDKSAQFLSNLIYSALYPVVRSN